MNKALKDFLIWFSIFIGKTIGTLLVIGGIFIGFAYFIFGYGLHRDEPLDPKDSQSVQDYGGLFPKSEIETVVYERKTGRGAGQDPFVAHAVIFRINQKSIETIEKMASFTGTILKKSEQLQYQSYGCFYPITKGKTLENTEVLEMFKAADSYSDGKEKRFILLESPKGSINYLIDRKTRFVAACHMFYGQGSPWND